MKKLYNNRGITLIALVITIIVLLILAGAVISMVLKSNGILTKTIEAQQATDIANEMAKIRLAYANIKATEYAKPVGANGIVRAEDLEKQLKADFQSEDITVTEKTYEDGVIELTIQLPSGRKYVTDGSSALEVDLQT